MNKTILFTLALFVSSVINSQPLLRLEIRSLPPYHARSGDVYAAGSFNNWNPQDEKFKFKKDAGGNYFLEIRIPPGTYEFKITRGGWDKVEGLGTGEQIANRSLLVKQDTTVLIDIAGWIDHFPPKPKLSTASKNVRIIDSSFWMPQVKRKRKIWIYLPATYSDNTNERYPVMYMHDGQNVFDDATSFSGEWGVDDFLDTTSLPACIIVAIDNGGSKRMNEYNPYDHDRFGKGEGAAYVGFIAKTLKPYIDRNYRTRPGSNSTFISGSSMGGLISMYAVLRHPGIFGGAGVFSPSFAIGLRMIKEIEKKGEKFKGKIYFFAGKQEGERMVPDMLKAFEKMAAISKAKMTTVIRDDGKHDEATWRREFPAFYKWLFQ